MSIDSLLAGDLSRLPRGRFSPAERMIQLRVWQHLINELLKQKAFRIPIHLGFGTEALVSAIDEALQPGDDLVLTHRNAVFNMARASSLRGILEEYQLQESGLGRGRLGSMNLCNPDAGVAYSSRILANNLPVACGLAFAKSLRALSGMVCVLTGDGAMEEGALYESLVFSKSHGLRVLFVVDNNDYSMASRIGERRCSIDVGALCASIGVPFQSLSGNHLETYLQTVAGLRAKILQESGPALLECHTHLFNQHAGPTPGWPTDPLKIDMQEGLLVGDSPEDPIAKIREDIGLEKFEHIASQLGMQPTK